MHIRLWLFQCDLWCSLPQYHTCRHREHLCNFSRDPQNSQSTAGFIMFRPDSGFLVIVFADGRDEQLRIAREGAAPEGGASVHYLSRNISARLCSCVRSTFCRLFAYVRIRTCPDHSIELSNYTSVVRTIFC